METIALFYINIDYLNTAQDYLLKALKIHEEIDGKNHYYTCYLYLGILYYNLEDYAKAMPYYQKALGIAKKIRIDSMITHCYYYIGICYQKMGDYPHALDYLRKTRTLAEMHNNTNYIAASLSYLGHVYGEMDKHGQALELLLQALDIRRKTRHKDGEVKAGLYIANVYLKMKNYSKAAFYFDKTLKLAEQIDDRKTIERVYKDYSHLYKQKGDSGKALHYYELFFQTRETILNEKKLKRIADLEMKFEAEKREREILILKKDNEIQKITRNTSIVVLLLISALLIVVFKKYLYLLAFWKMHKYIGQYRLVEKIGSGGMGTVYRAHPISDKTDMVSIKVLREGLEDERNRRRFKQEGTIIDKLIHPNIVKILERGEYKGKLYIVMEYLPQETLADKIREEGALDLKQCFDYMTGLTDALVFIHQNKVVHRDIKPANIMMVEEKGIHSLKLLDFGVALMQFQTRLTQSGFLVGTISYTAPEQITENLYSPAGDIYSLGVTFYEMVTGEAAFPGTSVTAVIEKVLDKIPAEPLIARPDIPGELNRLIMQMIARESQHRPDAAEVSETLKAIHR